MEKVIEPEGCRASAVRCVKIGYGPDDNGYTPGVIPIYFGERYPNSQVERSGQGPPGTGCAAE